MRGGPLVVDAPTGSGKTVATLAPLLEHAEAADHRILYLVRTHAQEVQVLSEARAISHRLDRKFLAVSLAGRQRRCFLLEDVMEVKGATAEEHGKMCADRKRSTESAFQAGSELAQPSEMPEDGLIDFRDLDSCPYYGRVLQADLDSLTDRFREKVSTPAEYEDYCRSEFLCPYELAKLLVPRARLVTAPYAFFFHPHIRQSLYRWIGVGPERVDLVIDEAHNLPEHLRELSTVALPQESVRRARSEILERGDFQLPDGPGAARFLEVVGQAIDELVDHYAPEDDGVLPPQAFEDALLSSLGGTSHRVDTWMGALATWGESYREELRKERRLPRSWAFSVALTLLSWPPLEPPGYVKVVSRHPRRTLEAFALDAAQAAAPILDCHLSIHLSGTLAPLEEYRDSLGLGEAATLLSVPWDFPPENRRFLYDASVTTRYEELKNDPTAITRLADRLSEILEKLPVKTAVFFPSFEVMDRVLAAGLASELPGSTVVESKKMPMGDLWRSVEVFRKDPGGGLLLGVAGGRMSEGIDFPNEELEAVVVVGIPYPRPTAKRTALRAFLDATRGRGWEYAVEAPAQRAVLQAFGRMIRSDKDRGIGILLDKRAPVLAKVLPGLEPLGDLSKTVREFYGRRVRLAPTRTSSDPERPIEQAGHSNR